MAWSVLTSIYIGGMMFNLKTMEAYLQGTSHVNIHQKITQEKPREYTPKPWYTENALETIQKQIISVCRSCSSQLW